MNSLKFKPNYKTPIWSGTKLSQFKHQTDNQMIGESWEVSTLPNESSIIENDPDTGLTLEQFIKRDPIAILGKTVVDKFGSKLPLLFKFIDAGDDLSLQVHPNDQIAKSRGLERGKTEMWYVIKADQNAKIIAGLSKSTSFDELSNAINENCIHDYVVTHNVQQGDLFYIEAGTIHGIGKGILLAEIQQASDATYRLFDYNRKDSFGKSRELHLDLAKDSISYEPNKTKIEYSRKQERVTSLIKSPYFTSNLLQISQDKNLIRDLQSLNTFIVYMCTQGEVVYMDAGGNEGTIKSGETLFVPANLSDIVFIGKETAELLEIYIE